jgi:predicted transcriptional regulator
MITDFQTLRPNDRLSRAVDYVVAGFQQDFPVVEGDRLVGVLAHVDLGPALAEHGPEGAVGEVMRRDCEVVSPREMLESAFARLQHGECHTWPVVDNGQLVGLLTTENVTEVLMIREALRAAGRVAGPPTDGRERRDGAVS